MRARRQEDLVSTPTSSSTTSPRKKPPKRANIGKMEMYDQFYTKFERPPMAPVYRPTAEEFADPIEYVAKIRAEAEKYGVVKIVPPENFKPPFAIDKNTFVFRPRTQKLNEVEAIVKEKHTFVDRLINFNRYSGLTFEFPVDKDGNIVDLHRLHRIVQNFGGCEVVNEEEKWRDVAREYLPAGQLTRGVPTSFINLIRSHYNLHIEPFNRNLKEKAMKKDDESDDEAEELKHKYQHHHGTMRTEAEEEKDVKPENEEDCPVSMQSGRRRSKNRKTPTKRMSGGSSKKSVSPKRKNKKGKQQPTVEKEEEEDDDEDPMDQVFCITCHQGKDEDLLLLCDIDGCTNGRHTYCCDPVLDEVPEGEWRCPKCIEAEDAKIGCDWGFYDADTEYNLNSFTEYANQFKCDYFGVNAPGDVSCEAVEREFWRNVISSERNVAVKYGADLITSRVGSGFPRKEDTHLTGALNEEYANHAWNLNNMPVLQESVLSHFNTGISGMMVPWVYVGMCFSTFCWHTEDHWTYSVNYNHFGERKIWYGVSGDDAEKFEEALRKLAPGLTGRQRDLFHHMTTAANPALLRSMGVPIYSVHQNAGEFVITFPRAYHAGFNEGLNFAEAVNFAPIDWLAKGRHCVQSYASVRRYLVFSHDELVYKMVEGGEKLGLSMALAALDQLNLIRDDLSRKRVEVEKLGIPASRVEKVVFEKIPDEIRSCRLCKTTLFIAGISCKHKRMTCVEHYEHVCKACNLRDLRYHVRFDAYQINKLCNELKRRTERYLGLAIKKEEIIESKPPLENIEEFIDVAQQNKFPQTDQVSKLVNIKQAARSALERANQLLLKKVRTRTKTRCQRADTRTDTEGVKALIEHMRSMDCNLAAVAEKLQQLVEQVDEWRARARDVIEHETSHSKDDVEQMIEVGEEFDIKLPEIEQLRKVIEMKEWLVRARELAMWTAIDGMEKDVEFEYRRRWTSADVLALIRDGTRWGSELTLVLTQKLQEMLKDAHIREMRALEFNRNPSLENLMTVWNNVRESDWFNDREIDMLRSEIVMVMRVKSLIDSSIPKLADEELAVQLERLPDSETTLSKMLEICKACDASKCLGKSTERVALLDTIDKITAFTERIAKLFKPINAYHNLFEIVSEREDLTHLAEGQTLQLYFQGGARPTDEWHQMAEFSSLDQLLHHQTSLREVQTRIFEKVREFNATRDLETCSCLGNAKVDSQEPVLACMLCDSKFHVRCSEWSQFLQLLPAGSFLCVRCLRGRRPVIDDVIAAMNGAPAGCLETSLVRNLIQKTRTVTQNLMEVSRKRKAGETADDETSRAALAEWLSCEILNTNGLMEAVEMINELYGDYLQRQTDASHALQRRPISSKPSVSLFDPKSSVSRRKRSTGVVNKEASTKKSRRRSSQHASPTEYVDEEEEAELKTCQASNCLKPYSDSLNWVMCEAGCKNWFHVICVGFTLKEINSMHQYRCTSCLDHADSPSSSASLD